VTGPLVVGLSYRTAPLELLERASLDDARRRTLESRLCASEHIDEAAVLSTCNRLEVYTWVGRFHGGLATVTEALGGITGLDVQRLSDHLYVHYDAGAVEQVFSVAAGLDSMAVGEPQILGQVRAAVRQAQEGGTLTGSLATLLQQALRVGKRVHAETDLDKVGASLVETGLARARAVVGDLGSAHALVLGAGAMSGLAVATLRRAGIGALTVANRTPERAARLAATAGGTARDLSDLDRALAQADVVIACAGALGHLVTFADAKHGIEVRGGRAQVYLDLALPRDVDPAVADLDGVDVIDLERLGRFLAAEAGADADPAGDAGVLTRAALAQARGLLEEETRAYLLGRTAHQVAPTVAALRGMAAEVVAAELRRARSRLADQVGEKVMAELEQTVHRVVEKLLHTPTVRVKELATQPDGAAYAEALQELFGLDLSHVAEVSRVVTTPGAGGVP